ncbi:S-adenosyl-L-methionine-dependent methyltransferase [Pleurotus eryngii]|uniref:S-adenosyl-L-methionine-dependent methyltransferase n=1 Tax=Pleurotus eryngii TaxID=5323 RepID=A0A9P6A3D1_PLEER|nr:S-adenosyl-L-methionine-dependent methyltransferase [Pleurotus eryngii]
MTDYLTALVQIIASNVKTLQSAYAKNGSSYPSLDEPLDPTQAAEIAANNDVQENTRLIVAAATQLIASVRSPFDVLGEQATGMYNTVTLSFVNDHNVADLLKEAGPQGLDAKEIGRKISVDGVYVAQCLRYLATRHIFREVKPNVFANNRLSFALVKSKPFKEIESDMITKYDDAPVSAFVGHVTDEGLIGSQSLIEFMRHPKGYSSPLSMALQEHTSMFEWYAQPAQTWRARRFATAMKAPAKLRGQGAYASALDWNALPSGSTIVDVGAGTGIVTMEIARSAPQHKYVLHDLEGGIAAAQRHWAKEWPEAIGNGIVTLEVHSFFDPMPVQADVYFMRAIIHDWPEAECRKILGHLNAAAKSTSKLVLFEMMALHACPDELVGSNIVPYPLLANLGIAGAGFVTMIDMHMISLLNGRERTAREYEELGRQTGWKLETVKPGLVPAFIFSKAME